MGTEWRRKTYYKPRVLIETQRILDPQFSDCVVCLTGPQLEMMRNLTQYLHRRSTFAEGYETDYYLAPTEADWDDIQAIVASLEDTLMDCEAFTAKLESILDAALCACSGVDGGYTTPVTGPVYQDLEGDGIVEWAPEDPTPTPAEAAACALAQLVYAWNYEILTETLQPIQEAGHEVLLFLVIEAFAGMIGGPPGLIAGGALFYVIQALLDAWVEGELANVTNALIANKDELICEMYLAFVDGGDYGDAAAAARAHIATVSAWSTIDKALFNLTFSPLAMKICQAAITASSDWADANVVEAYCVDCDDPIIGETWWAQPIVGLEGKVELHSTEIGWTTESWVVDIPDALLVGIIYTYDEETGAGKNVMPDGDVGRCPVNGRHQMVITGPNLTEEETYFHTHTDTVDYDYQDAHDELFPTAIRIPANPAHNYFATDQGPSTCQYCWSMEVADPFIGSAYLTVKYLVYRLDP